MREKKDRSVLSKLGPSDILGGSISLLSISWSGYNAIKNKEIGWSLLFCLISQSLVIIAWIYIIWYRYKGVSQIEEHDKAKKDAEGKIEQEKQRAVQKIAETEKERDLIKRSLGAISFAVKLNSIHLNSILRKIPEKGDAQYEIVGTVQKLIDMDKPEHVEIAQKQFEESNRRYADDLFELARDFFSMSTGNIKSVEETLIKIKGYRCNVSVTIKLFTRPYQSDDHIDDFHVYTAFRDEETTKQEKREIGERLFSVGNNSDFVQCLRKESYIKNHMKPNEPNYMNENPLFLEFYNCTVVVPIKIKYSEAEQKFYGFLCCECKDDSDEEIYDQVSAQYLYSFSQNIATLLETLDTNWIDRVGMIRSSVEEELIEESKKDEVEPVEKDILELIYHRTMKHQG